MKDKNGVELQLGDRIVWAGSQGYSGKVVLREGTVVKIMQLIDWRGNRVERVSAREAGQGATGTYVPLRSPRRIMKLA